MSRLLYTLETNVGIKGLVGIATGGVLIILSALIYLIGRISISESQAKKALEAEQSQETTISVQDTVTKKLTTPVDSIVVDGSVYYLKKAAPLDSIVVDGNVYHLKRTANEIER
jgi:Na+-transporting methylmalonyl-CoA/oxaloacetate decarboxylase gamma subunit